MKDEECPLTKSDIIEMQRDVSDGGAMLATKTSSLVMPTAVALQALLQLPKIVYFFLLCERVHAQEMETSANT